MNLPKISYDICWVKALPRHGSTEQHLWTPSPIPLHPAGRTGTSFLALFLNVAVWEWAEKVCETGTVFGGSLADLYCLQSFD